MNKLESVTAAAAAAAAAEAAAAAAAAAAPTELFGPYSYLSIPSIEKRL
jgi:hypothetical protein